MRGEFLSDVLGEEWADGRAVDDQRGEYPAEAEGGDEGGGLPVPVGRGVVDPLVRRPPPVEAGRGGGAEGFVEEDEAAGVDAGGEDLPDRAAGDDVGASPFGGVERFV